MINQEDDMNANDPKYASLTAGLLARKGEAVPAAAAFTAEAIAQHIPARRLAQEAERVLMDRHPIVDESSNGNSIAWQASDHEGQGAQVVAEHRDLIEQAFNESAKQEKGMPLVDGIRKLLGQGSEEDSSEEQESEEQTPETASRPEEALVENRRELDLPDAQSLLSGEPARQEMEDGSALSDLNDSDNNWFESIVSNAINEAEGRNSGSEAEASLSSESFTRGMAGDRTEPGPSESSEEPAPPVAPTGGCSEKAASVRQTIKSGKTLAASRSAMRLDPRRFIRLSLAARKLQLTSQEVMVASLDTYLDALDEEVFSECSCLKKGLI